MPFDSRKQQQWYNATGQDYLDNEPTSSRKVKGNELFKFCSKCMEMRQFLPNGYDDLPRHCDVCGAEEYYQDEDNTMQEIDLDKLFGDNFVKKDTERFGEGVGGSLDHFYDKIFESLSTEEWVDSDNDVEKYSQSMIDELNQKGIIFLENESEEVEPNPDFEKHSTIKFLQNEYGLSEEEAEKEYEEGIKEWDGEGIKDTLGDILSGDIIFTEDEREELKKMRGEAHDRFDEFNNVVNDVMNKPENYNNSIESPAVKQEVMSRMNISEQEFNNLLQKGQSYDRYGDDDG